jgi:hypothetical protein
VISIVVAAVIAESAVAAIGPAFRRPRARVGEALSVFQPGGLSWFHDTKLDGQPQATFGIESAAAVRVCDGHRTLPRGRE